MKTLKLIKLFIVALLAFSFILSCNRSENDSLEPTGQDPIIGNWHLKAVTVNGQSADVSNAACWKDTKLNINSTTANFLLSVPNENTGNCENAQENYNWVKNNGVYYYTENGQQAQMPIKLLDNNQTLQLSLAEQSTTIIFSFRK